MASGEFSPAQRSAIDRAIRRAETSSRFEFSVYVGPVEPPARDYARALHGSLTNPARSVLVLVDPAARVLEIITGATVRRVLSDETVGLAAVTMQSAFGAGDLVGGIERGLHQLADAARRPQTLHS